MIYVGPAGFDYPDWKGIVYPAPAPRRFDPLKFLAGFYDVVEINSTFYRPLDPRVARTWCARVAERPAFRFTAKLYRRFTHERDHPFSFAEVRQAREGLEALAGERRLGAVLVQFPWSFRRDPAGREWLRDLVVAFAGLPLAVELRHASWNDPRTFDELAEWGAGFVNIDQPRFRHSMGPSAHATAPVGYVRVHGRNFKAWFRPDAGRDARYDYFYSAQELEPWAARARALDAGGTTKEIYVVTNNHFRGQAAANAVMLRSMIEDRPVEAPPDLARRYAAALAPFAIGERGDAVRSDASRADPRPGEPLEEQPPADLFGSSS